MFSRFSRYGALNSHDILKACALIIMCIDHIGAYWYDSPEYLRLIGRFAVPLFLFLVGYSHQFIFRWNITIYALILSVFLWYIDQPIFPLHILWSIIITRAIIAYAEKKKAMNVQSMSMIVGALLVCLPLTYSIWDYGSLAVGFALLGYWQRQKTEHYYYTLFSVVIACIYSAWQSYVFHFSIPSIIITTLVTMLIVWKMTGYQQQPVTKSTNAWIAGPILCVSRYSLEFYVLHLIIIHMIVYPF